MKKLLQAAQLLLAKLTPAEEQEQAKIIDQHNPKLAFEFIKNHAGENIDVGALQAILLKEGDPYRLAWLAALVKNADASRIVRTISSSKDANAAVILLTHREDIPSQDLLKVIANYGKGAEALAVARLYDDPTITKQVSGAAAKGTPTEIIDFMDHVGANVKELESGLLNSTEVSPIDLVTFAKKAAHSNPKIDLSDIGTKLTQLNNVKSVLKFIVFNPTVKNFSTLAKYIKKNTDDITDVYNTALVAAHSNNTDVTKDLEKEIISYYDPTYIRMFAVNIPNANIPALEKALLNSEDTTKDDILLFAKQVPNCDVNKLYKEYLLEGGHPDSFRPILEQKGIKPSLLKVIDSLKPIKSVSYHELGKDLHELRRYLPITVEKLLSTHVKLAMNLSSLIKFSKGKELTEKLVNAYEKTLPADEITVVMQEDKGKNRSINNSSIYSVRNRAKLPQIVLSIVAPDYIVNALERLDLYTTFNATNEFGKSKGLPYTKDQIGWVTLEIDPDKHYLLIDDIHSEHKMHTDTQWLNERALYQYDKTALDNMDALKHQLEQISAMVTEDFHNIAMHVVTMFAKQNGFEKIFTHTINSTKNLKGIDSESVPTEVPDQNYFTVTDNKPFSLPSTFFERKAST